MNKQKQKHKKRLTLYQIGKWKHFHLTPLINLAEEGIWLLAVKNFEATNSVSKTTNENNSFAITIPAHWNSEAAEKNR